MIKQDFLNFLIVSVLASLILSFQNCSKAKFTEHAALESQTIIAEPMVEETATPIPKAPAGTTPPPPVVPPVPKEPVGPTPVTPTDGGEKRNCSGSFDLAVWSDVRKDGIIQGNSVIAVINSYTNRTKFSSSGANIHGVRTVDPSTQKTRLALGMHLTSNSVRLICAGFKNNFKSVSVIFDPNDSVDLVIGLLDDDTEYFHCVFQAQSQYAQFATHSSSTSEVKIAKVDSVIITNNCGNFTAK
jgi:hypothetical protein